MSRAPQETQHPVVVQTISQAGTQTGTRPPATGVIVLTQETYIAGLCPYCRRGILRTEYPCISIFCAIFFFPLGLICCLLTSVQWCPYCGATFY